MGDRSQIYIRYNQNKLLAIQVNYAYGADLIKRAFSYAENAVLSLEKNEKPKVIDEKLLDSFFCNVHSGKKDMKDYTIIFNHSNQCGKCFIEITPDNIVKYCFTDDGCSYPVGNQSPLSYKDYIDWCVDSGVDEADDGNNIPSNPYVLMSDAELRDFIQYSYDVEEMYMEYLKGFKPSQRMVEEVLKSSREEFFKKNGYYGTNEDAVRLTEEAREEIRMEKEWKQLKFGVFRKYISKIDCVSIYNKDTLQYENYMFIDEVPEKYDELYLFGISKIQSKFKASQAPDVVMEMSEKMALDDIVYADCIEIMLSKLPRSDW
ncbi:MAG: hypothetical protein IJ060_11130 [Oscillospiraceae bacterium]|nr:hypothetical protein [Oscillospiraceae bacterium]